MLDKIESKHNDKEGAWQRKKKTLSEVEPVENLSKNPQSFLEIRPMQKKVLLTHKFQDRLGEEWRAIARA